MIKTAVSKNRQHSVAQQGMYRKFKPFLPIFVMMLPGMIYLLINNYLPMFGLIIAFKNIDYSKGILGSDWNGFTNFKFLFQTTDAYIITRNTLLYNGAFIILGLFMSVGVAILLNEVKNRFMSRTYQTVILLPFLISMVIVSYLAFGFLGNEQGYLNNKILPMLGLEPISWYMESKYWPYILTIVNLWKSVGFNCIVYLAAIIGIDQEYYEAATLDGASKWQQFRTVTIPLIAPTVITMTLLAVGRIFYSDFGLFYQVPMNSGMIYDTTNVIDTYVFRGLLLNNDIGMSAAAGLYQSVVGFVLVILSNFAVRKFSKDNALF
ncbi:putative aldouronate transport system permease protein [Paenibacillus cellulosilyticus]|uniref:Putative aldouronate transport system permease protein n=2 Tax=Paenibacillus cellulosilyticus TaxID=375489 RepID=A0A2V2YEG9_9BACL|nr:putative aldouronate transport system permease protein [Paenibacillus cellulosilyticus]